MSELHVVFRVASTEYVIPASEVLRMESYEGATPVPGAPPYLAGVVQVRGRFVPVVDLRARFGLPPAPLSIDSRIVVGQSGDRPVALLVDSAREVLHLSPEQLRPPPPMVVEQCAGYVSAVARVGERFVMLIDFRKVIGEEQRDEG
ncbi:MAG: chemotaxis protein CheW [Deltaproteobacteria bacterium]|nr:chemotaxis protein CheW [Myxococcales bacterium]MDP3219316.1 chemotaxis protein CheW [Deltaproteobacteria bacterium]